MGVNKAWQEHLVRAIHVMISINNLDSLGLCDSGNLAFFQENILSRIRSVHSRKKDVRHQGCFGRRTRAQKFIVSFAVVGGCHDVWIVLEAQAKLIVLTESMAGALKESTKLQNENSSKDFLCRKEGLSVRLLVRSFVFSFVRLCSFVYAFVPSFVCSFVAWY